MAGRAFRLAAVLRVREIQERQAKGEVGLAQQALLGAQQEAAQRLALAQRWRPTPGVSVEQFRAELAHGLTLGANVTTANLAVTAAEEVLAQRQTDWQHAKQRVKPLERLAEHHTEALTAADLKTDQAAADEIAGSRWRRG
jgi:flagellar FliJ protein